MTEAIDSTIDQTTRIVASFVAHNAISSGDVPKLISETHKALISLTAKPEPEPSAPAPKVAVRSSIKPDRIICLHCAKSLKSLKRHLGTHHNQTPDEYRRAFDLPASYPMVAPLYSETRSRLAKQSGLGRKAARR
jgi:predicted transcriptional regulator